MPPKSNPLKLNALQLRTLTLLQGLASLPDCAERAANGEVTVTRFPQAHGDHFHLGRAVVTAKDATGLYNEAVWNALSRKGLARADWPHRITLTREGLSYVTGLAEEIFHLSPH
jgi:ribosomal protein S19E (S16A)